MSDFSLIDNSITDPEHENSSSSFLTDSSDMYVDNTTVFIVPATFCDQTPDTLVELRVINTTVAQEVSATVTTE